MSFWTTSLERYPDYWSAYAERASVYLDWERYPEAIRNYATALRLNPNDAELVSALGICHHGLHQYKQAEASFQRAIQLDPKLASAFTNLAALYVDMGKLEAAEGAYLQVLKINQKMSRYFANLAACNSKLERKI